MTGDAALSFLIPTLAALYLCLYAPAQAWWHGRSATLPPAFASLALSLAWTTAVGLALAAVDRFSLPRLVAVNGLVALCGYLAGRAPRSAAPRPPARERIGPLIFSACLAAAWPAYTPLVGGADATAYLATGLHLARNHRTWKHDPIVEELPRILRRRVFPSAVGQPWKPPYSRMLGGMVIDTPDSSTVRPSFFPAPSVWAAIFGDALGARYAAAFAPLLAAVAAWGRWRVARARVPAPAALLCVVLASVNAGALWAARTPLAEPLAWGLLWAGLAAFDAWRRGGRAADGWAAGLLLGATGMARIEYLGLIGLGLIAWKLAAPASRPPEAPSILPLTGGLLLMTAATLGESFTLPGAYAAPCAELWSGLRYQATQRSRAQLVGLSLGGWLAASFVAGAHRLRLAGRSLGRVRAALLLALAAGIWAYVHSSHPRLDRSLPWMLAYLGWPTLLLGPAGFWTLWARRAREPGNTLLVLLSLLVTGLLVYNTRVWPELPWAIRRFVPLVFPVSILAATVGAAWLSAAIRAWFDRQAAGTARAPLARLALGSISGIGRAAVWIALVAGLLLPARGFWRKPYYANAADQLGELAELIPAGTIVLLDDRLARFVLPTPLWLLYDRNSVPVYAASRQGRNMIAALVANLEDRGPLMLLEPSATRGPEPIPFVRKTRAFDYTLELLLPGSPSDPIPLRAQRHYFHLSAFHLRRVGRPLQLAPRSR